MKKELIKKARQADLAGYLLSVGVPLVKIGNRYKHKKHDSLTFSQNSYYWNSRQESGNAVDYLTRHMNMDFAEAVAVLVAEPHADERPPTTQKAFNSADLAINRDNAKVIQYLNKTRHIGRNIIEYLIENRLLLQEKRTNNAVFQMHDEDNIIVGAELQGILAEKRFKGVKAGSKYGYGFNVRFSDDNTFDYALFFESAVDLLSFIDYKINHDKKNLDKCILISMAGLKENILRHTLKTFRGNLNVVLCVDNDEAGRNFQDKITGAKIPFITRTPAEQFKDWNEQITEWRERKPINRVLDRYRLK